MILSEDDRLRMGTMHPHMASTLEHSPFPDLTPTHAGESLRANRAAHLAQLRHLYPVPHDASDEVSESDHHVPVRDSSTVRVRVYVPTNKKPMQKARPLILAFHEGGWCMGDLTDEEGNCRLYSRELGAVCVNVEYRLAPEHVFPTSVTDAYDVLKWCARTAAPDSAILPADPRVGGFVVGGASAGGNLAAVVCQMARDEGLTPPLTGQYLSVPAILWSTDVPIKWRSDYRSRCESTDDPVLKLKPDRGEETLRTLRPDTASPLFSPLLHPNLKDLPRAFFQIAGLDPLRDEGLIYEKELRENNTVTRLNVYDGFGHMFWVSPALACWLSFSLLVLTHAD